jgi:hypothetical protein
VVTDPLAMWWVHQVTVRRLTGTGAYGDQFAAPVMYEGLVDDKIQTVRGPDGNETTSTSTLALPWSVADVPPGSKVTLPSGREARVITFARGDAGGLPVPKHLELTLT